MLEFAAELNETTNTFEIHCVFLNGEYLSSDLRKLGMEKLRSLVDDEAQKNLRNGNSRTGD